MIALRISTSRSPSSALSRRIRRHRRAFLAYDRLVPLGDPMDPRFVPSQSFELERWQRRENRRRLELLDHPVRTLADVSAKAFYLLSYPGSDHLVSGEEEVARLLRSLGNARSAIDNRNIECRRSSRFSLSIADWALPRRRKLHAE